MASQCMSWSATGLYVGCSGSSTLARTSTTPFCKWSRVHSPGKANRSRGFVVAAGKPLEFGARDPSPAEVESKFGTKVLGNAGTDHIILIPPSSLGLSEKNCTRSPAGPLSEVEAKSLLRKVLGWRLINTERGIKLQCELKLKNFASGVQYLDRVGAIAVVEDHHPLLLQLEGNVARVELSTLSCRGLTENDYILAAKIDKIDTSDLVEKKKRFWA